MKEIAWYSVRDGQLAAIEAVVVAADQVQEKDPLISSGVSTNCNTEESCPLYAGVSIDAVCMEELRHSPSILSLSDLSRQSAHWLLFFQRRKSVVDSDGIVSEKCRRMTRVCEKAFSSFPCFSLHPGRSHASNMARNAYLREVDRGSAEGSVCYEAYCGLLDYQETSRHVVWESRLGMKFRAHLTRRTGQQEGKHDRGRKEATATCG